MVGRRRAKVLEQRRRWRRRGIYAALAVGGFVLLGLLWPLVQTDEMGMADRTLWDYLQLVFVPLALAVAAFGLNRQERKAERELAEENQNEMVLQEYMDRITGLLLEQPPPDAETRARVRAVTEARTTMAFRRLDSKRQASLVHFLIDSGLARSDLVSLSMAQLRGTDLRGAELASATLRGANLSSADLRGASFNGADLRAADLRWADLCEADLSKPEFLSTHLGDEQDRGSDISLDAPQRAARVRCDLSVANLRWANLSEADLRGANLRQADLRMADLKGADLRGAELHGADLRGADLRRANLRNVVDIQDARFEGANLAGIHLGPGWAVQDGMIVSVEGIEDTRKGAPGADPAVIVERLDSVDR